jgi:uncharacterized protein (DUF1800 family)
MLSPFPRLKAASLVVVLALPLAGCLSGGGGGGDGGGGSSGTVGPSSYQYAKPNSAEAARFLHQSTYGPTPDEIEALKSAGYLEWVDAQFQIAPTSHVAYLDAEKARGENVWQHKVMESFWMQAAHGTDQLRQRMVFALSQIFVVSTESSSLGDQPWGLASYLDMLGRNAFGNYRQLLEDVALHPAMGLYLSHLGNEKEDAATGRTPDENFAREVLQLFSIGLHQLNPDGSAKRDGSGNRIPTYDLDTVMGMARVFTGWSWGGPDKSDNRFRGWRNEEVNQNHWRTPMQSYPKFHSTAAKEILNDVIIPAGGTAEQDLKVALDAIFNHPNTGPFISFRLIQRLVTSNPSAAYVTRVSTAFANNGAGVRGDMQAVIRAVLLDPEARDMAQLRSTTFGKVREPVLRLGNWLRMASAASDQGTMRIHNLEDPVWSLGQNPLRSPSVFNFYRPEYSPPGTVARAGLMAPEYQIVHETSVTGNINFFQSVIERGYGWEEGHIIKPRYERLYAFTPSADALTGEVDLMLFSGGMSAELRTGIIAAVNNVRSGTTDWQKKRVQAALFVAMSAPEYVVQK